MLKQPVYNTNDIIRAAARSVAVCEAVHFVDEENAGCRADSLVDFVGQSLEHVALMSMSLAVRIACGDEGDIQTARDCGGQQRFAVSGWAVEQDG